MKRTQETLTAGKYDYRAIVGKMTRNGFKELPFGERRVPDGTREKHVIIIRRWRGEWAGYHTFKGHVFYK